MSAVPEPEELHRLVDRLTPGQVRELHAYALRLVESGGRRTFVPWHELKDSADRLPAMDFRRFQDDVDAGIDQNHLLGDER
ncbi:MAG: hypothetical protein GEV11_20275 [Streptosporangiales bacterium]|nr:hypothetical protein [Streptosporangiales bacterium]